MRHDHRSPGAAPEPRRAAARSPRQSHAWARRQQGQLMSSGVIVISTRGRWAASLGTAIVPQLRCEPINVGLIRTNGRSKVGRLSICALAGLQLLLAVEAWVARALSRRRRGRRPAFQGRPPRGRRLAIQAQPGVSNRAGVYSLSNRRTNLTPDWIWVNLRLTIEAEGPRVPEA
jgi:hypothetical protein